MTYSCLAFNAFVFFRLVGSVQETRDRRRGVRQKSCSCRDDSVEIRLEQAKPQIHNPLLDDLLPLLVSMLPLQVFPRCFQACRQWHGLLRQAKLWQFFCRSAYPGIRWPDGNLGLWRESLRQIVTGQALLKSLKALPEDRCGCGKSLSRHVVREGDSFNCDICGSHDLPVGTTMWGCRSCNFDKCFNCRQQSCRKPPEAKRVEACRNGHTLQGHVVACSGQKCDSCGMEHIPIGADVWSCSCCSFHKCWLCVQCPSAPPLALADGARNCFDSEGWTGMHHAARLGYCEIIERLLAAKAHVDVADRNYGFTPLMIAATHGQREVCSLLLKEGASMDVLNNFGRSAHDCASRWGHRDLEPLLIMDGLGD